MAFMTAGAIKLRDPLKDPLSGISQQRQSSLQDTLGRITANSRASQAASGRPMGEYAGYALGNANTLASRGIDDSLYGVIGNTSYKEDRADRDHLRKIELAKKLGKMNSPSTLQEIIGGIGSLGPLIPAGQSLYRSMQRQPQIPTWAMGGYGDDEWEGLI